MPAPTPHPRPGLWRGAPPAALHCLFTHLLSTSDTPYAEWLRCEVGIRALTDLLMYDFATEPGPLREMALLPSLSCSSSADHPPMAFLVQCPFMPAEPVDGDTFGEPRRLVLRLLSALLPPTITCRQGPSQRPALEAAWGDAEAAPLSTTEAAHLLHPLLLPRRTAPELAALLQFLAHLLETVPAPPAALLTALFYPSASLDPPLFDPWAGPWPPPLLHLGQPHTRLSHISTGGFLTQGKLYHDRFSSFRS